MESNDGRRIELICDEISKACQKDLDINLIKDKLEHNRNHFFDVQNSVDIFNNLFTEMLKRDK